MRAQVLIWSEKSKQQKRREAEQIAEEKKLPMYGERCRRPPMRAWPSRGSCGAALCFRYNEATEKIVLQRCHRNSTEKAVLYSRPFPCPRPPALP